MTNREKILLAIKVNKPEVVPLPELSTFDYPDQDQLDVFTEKAKEIGCMVEVLEGEFTIDDLVRKHYPEAQRIFCPMPECGLGNIASKTINQPRDMLPLDLTILEGQLGVAENGGIWVTESEMVHRVSPFITEHLVLVLDRSKVVGNMHEAYEKIRIDETGFGVFIAGPSKTGDIEQALVMGAQAARSLLVVLI